MIATAFKTAAGIALALGHAALLCCSSAYATWHLCRVLDHLDATDDAAD